MSETTESGSVTLLFNDSVKFMNQRCICRVDFLDSAIDPHYRVVELPYDVTLPVLHQAVVQAFGLPEGGFATFYQANEKGELGTAIPLAAMDKGGMSAEDFRIQDLLSPEHPYMGYIWDPLRNLQFFVQLVKVAPSDREGVWVVEEAGPSIDVAQYTPKTGLSPEDEDLLRDLWRDSE